MLFSLLLLIGPTLLVLSAITRIAVAFGVATPRDLSWLLFCLGLLLCFADVVFVVAFVASVGGS